ncbi:MAG: right-handed parallel beta-helix repeat-containing protein [Clostridiales bacterium]|nr:right-handed parallel beta-helix repeat-containing protein [Clostridiales bacterium]
MRKIIYLFLGVIFCICLLVGCGSNQNAEGTTGADASEPSSDGETDEWLTLGLGDNAVNILDFGAVGDGITDDAAALQAAIDEVTSYEDGGTVYLPAGIYRVETWIILKSNLTLYMDDDATILNGINTSSGTSIIFMNGEYTGSGSACEWERIYNLSFIGGTIDMNGELNAAQTAPVNLPAVVSSTGAFAMGYATNVTFSGVTFRDSFNGHAIQLCNCDTVLIEDCTFIGQSLPASQSDSENSQKEYIQIESSSTAGFPYAANETWEATTNVTITGCYFGASDKCGEPMVAIGTHSQKADFEKCNDIIIENNTFDNMAYGAVRFAGYEDVTITGNTFIKKSKRESTNFRTGTSVLINVFCVGNTSDELDLNKRITITDNTFEIDDPDTRAIRVGKDKAEYMGEVSDIVITGNKITNTSDTDSQMMISAIRVKNLTLTNNTLDGGYRGLYVDRCYGTLTINGNTAENVTAESAYIRYTGTNEAVSFYASDNGMIEVTTSGSSYTFSAVAPEGASFTGFYTDDAGSTLLSAAQSLTYSFSQSSEVTAYAQFQ